MDKRVSTHNINLHPAGLRLLRAAGVPTSLEGAARTLSITQSCLSQAQVLWPDAPFQEWKVTMGDVKVELDHAVKLESIDSVLLFSGAGPANAVGQEIQRWGMSVTTAQEATLLALMGRALVVYQRTGSPVPAELLKGLHTLRLAKIQKGRRSSGWDALVGADLTSRDQVQQLLEASAPMSPTHGFLAALSFVLITSVQPPTTETLKSIARPDDGVDEAEKPLRTKPASPSTGLNKDTDTHTPAEGQGSPETALENSLSPRISARMAAGDYSSVAEKLGLHDRDHLLLDDLVSITKQLVPIIDAEDMVSCGFAVLAMLSLISCTSDHLTLNMGFEPAADGIWLELDKGAWAWDYGSYLKSGSTQIANTSIVPVTVPMPARLHQVLSDARQRSPAAGTVGELLCLIQGVALFDLTSYREFLRGLGDSAHPPYQGRFSRSYQSCLLAITGSDMLTAILSASFSMTAPAALFYFGPTYHTIYSQLDRVFLVLEIGSAAKLLPERSRAGCKAIPTEEECRTGWENLVQACNELRRRCQSANDDEARVHQANEWIEHLCAAFVLKVAHRGTRLELLTAKALLTDPALGVIHDKDDTTKRERQHARLLPWIPVVQSILAAAIECHALMGKKSAETAVSVEADEPVFRKFSADNNGVVEAVSSQSVAKIIAHFFSGAPINVGRAIWVTGLDQAGCDRWCIRSLTGHTRDITRVGDAMFDVSPLETARRLHCPMIEVSAKWFGQIEVEYAPHPFKQVPTREHLLTNERVSRRPGVPDPRTLLHPIDANVLWAWKLAQQVRSALLRGEIPGSPGALGLLHLVFLDLLPEPEIAVRVIDPKDATAWHSCEPFPAVLWSRAHFKHPFWLPILPSTWVLLQKAQPANRADLLAEIEVGIRSSKHSEAFAAKTDVWQVLCDFAKAFRRLEMQPTMQAVSHPLVPAPCLNPQSIARLASPDMCHHDAITPRITASGARAKQARGSDLAGLAKVLNHVSNQDLRLGERRQRAILAIDGIKTLQMEWSPAGAWLREWVLDELFRSRENYPGGYQISSIATYLSTLLTDTSWTAWDEPLEWDETDWTAFVDLINFACDTTENDRKEEIAPRAKHALSALVRSLMRREQHVPHQVLGRLAESSESVAVWDSASSVLILHRDFQRAVELVGDWLVDEPATRLLATTRAAICASIPVRSGEVSSLPWDCLTRHGALVIRRTGFNNLKTETSIRTVKLNTGMEGTIKGAKDRVKLFAPGANLLMRGSGNGKDTGLDIKALEHWKEALKTATGDPKARPHSHRAAALQEIAWPDWQGIAREFMKGALTRAYAAAWLDLLQSKWHRLAQATAAAGQSGIQSAIGHYLAGWSIVHAVQALALLPDEGLRPSLLRQLTIQPDRYRQAKARANRSQDNWDDGSAFCNWNWLLKQTGTTAAPPKTEGKESAPRPRSQPASVHPEASEQIKLHYLCLTALGMPALQAQTELNIPWSQAVRLDQLSAPQMERDACTRRKRNVNGDRGPQADRDLCLSETGIQILTWLLCLQPQLLEFFTLALLREKPTDEHVFEDHQRWQGVMKGMPSQLCIVVRRGKAYLTAESVARALQDRPRFQLVPDPKLGRRPVVRLTLAEKDNRVASARLTSVVRVAVLSLNQLRKHKVREP